MRVPDKVLGDVRAQLVANNVCTKGLQNLLKEYNLIGLEELGAEVIIKGNDVEEAERYVNKLVKIKGLVKVHPFDDYEVIYGQGTLMLEMLQQCPELDLLILPVVGGSSFPPTNIRVPSGLNAKVLKCFTSVLPSLCLASNSAEDESQGVVKL